MRCLYCGKHLPLLRKLTGGGEFCSDAHRDKYHEEYNRLAVSRLLQAQSRPEEQKSSAPSEPEEVQEQTTAVAVAEPEPELVSTSFIEEFKIPRIRPAVALTDVDIEVAPVVLESWGPLHPFVAYAPFFQPLEGGFLPSRANSRRIATASTEPGLASAYDVDHVLPPASECRLADCHPEEAGLLALHPTSAPRDSNIEPLELGVSAIEPPQPKPVITMLSSVWDSSCLPHAGSREVVLASMAVPDDAALEIAIIESFPGFQDLRPTFELTLKLLETVESIPPEPELELGAAVDDKAEVVLLTPLRVLETLCGDRKQKKPQEPPLSRSIKAVAIPSAAPATEVLAAGFDAILFVARPQLLRYGTHPLRPKMAIGTAAGPLSARSTTGSKNEASKIMRRSMLHLEDETRASDTDTELPSLFGKLGGLFGKKARTGKQEVGS